MAVAVQGAETGQLPLWVKPSPTLTGHSPGGRAWEAGLMGGKGSRVGTGSTASTPY